jgi:hypothetical protein
MYDEDKDNYKKVIHDDRKRKRKNELARKRRNRATGLDLEQEMFSLSSRYLVLFLTVSYRKESWEFIRLSTIQGDRDTFFRYMESNNHSLLSGIHGLIWRLEEGGRTGGLHLHLIIFYSRDRHDDVTVNRQLGDYWCRVITEGLGRYWNSNAYKEDFRDKYGIGIGQINRNGDPKRDSLQKIIANYMVKSNQIPRERREDDKLFGVRFFDRKRKRERP